MNITEYTESKRIETETEIIARLECELKRCNEELEHYRYLANKNENALHNLLFLLSNPYLRLDYSR